MKLPNMTPPETGPWGGRVVDWNCRIRSNRALGVGAVSDVNDLPRPAPPEPYDVVFDEDDEDGETARRVPISRAELHRRTKRWELDVASWDAAEAKRIAVGEPCTYSLRARCDDGVEFEAVSCDGKTWHVTKDTFRKSAEGTMFGHPTK